jgi:tRNA pseudouridine38-40 synthase
MRLKLTLQYCGTPYGGWQFQGARSTPKLPSVQGTLCSALNNLLKSPLLIPKQLVAAGRTDAGVHAHAQVAHADVPDTFASRAPTSWMEGLNHYLPKSIRVLDVAVVPETFHARFSAKARSYVYKLWVGRHLRPDLVGLVGHAPPRFTAAMNLAAMQTAVASLPVGVRTNFNSLRDAECQSKRPQCKLTHAALIELEPDFLQFSVGSDHFLHHMVRNIIGTLVQVGMNEREANLAPLLAAQDRALAGTTFAPDGLYLTEIQYN